MNKFTRGVLAVPAALVIWAWSGPVSGMGWGAPLLELSWATRCPCRSRCAWSRARNCCPSACVLRCSWRRQTGSFCRAGFGATVWPFGAHGFAHGADSHHGFDQRAGGHRVPHGRSRITRKWVSLVDPPDVQPPVSAAVVPGQPARQRGRTLRRHASCGRGGSVVERCARSDFAIERFGTQGPQLFLDRWREDGALETARPAKIRAPTDAGSGQEACLSRGQGCPGWSWTRWRPRRLWRLTRRWLRARRCRCLRKRPVPSFKSDAVLLQPSGRP